jgi:hypothetical protein
MFQRSIFIKLKSNSLARCCAIADTTCTNHVWVRWRYAAAKWLFQVGSLSHSLYSSKGSAISKSSEICSVVLLPWSCLEIPLWRWKSSRYNSMYSIIASVWHWYCAIWWKCTKFLTHNGASAWRESCCSLNGLEESPQTQDQSSAQVLLSLYHSIRSPGNLTCWIKKSQDMEVLSPKAGWNYQSWNDIWGKMLPTTWKDK